MPKAVEDTSLARVFFALGDSTRLILVSRLLAAGALSASVLASDQAISRQAIVKHLHVLEAAGLVTHERQGREVLYSLEKARIDEARAFLDAISADWDQALARLKHRVESNG